jgi:hypothetical protein
MQVVEIIGQTSRRSKCPGAPSRGSGFEHELEAALDDAVAGREAEQVGWNENGLAALNALYAAGLSSVSLGSRFSITFNGANLPNLINDFLPQRSTPKELMQSYMNPTRGSAVGQVNNLFVGQLLALQLNVLASDKNVAPLAPGLKHVVLPKKFAGVLLPANYTIEQVLADAHNALGGGGLPSSLPSSRRAAA